MVRQSVMRLFPERKDTVNPDGAMECTLNGVSWNGTEKQQRSVRYTRQHRIGVVVLLLLGMVSHYVAGSNFVEIPRVPDGEYRVTSWLLSSNDGFGHNYGTDEDNLRTFGIDAGVALRDRLLLHGDWTSFTDRNSTYEASKRIDEIRLLGGYRWLHRSNTLTKLKVFSGIGTLLYGDFGTLKIQERAHGINNAHPRSIPRQYDDPSAHLLLYSYAELYFPALFTNIHGYAHLTHTSDISLDLSGRYWVVHPMLQSSFAVSYKWNRVEHAGGVAENCYRRENGVWISNKTLIGPLLLERGWNLRTLHQYSYAGIRIGDFHKRTEGLSPFGFSYSLGWPIGHNSWVEFFRFYPFAEIQRLGFFVRTYHTENTIDNTITLADEDRLIRRTKETSFGAELSLHDPAEWTLLNGFIFCGAGFTRDTKATYDQLESRILTMKTTFMAHGGAGLRMMFPDVVTNAWLRRIGAEIRANVRLNAEDTGIYSNPDLLLSWGLVFTER
jgi:hypothetical protein